MDDDWAGVSGFEHDCYIDGLGMWSCMTIQDTLE